MSGWKRGAWIAGGVLVLVGAVLLALPGVLRWQGEKQLSALLGRQVTIDKISLAPWRLEASVQGVTVAGLAGVAEPQLRLERLRFDADISSVWKRAPVVTALEADGLRLRLTRTAAGHYDIDDLIQRFTPTAPPPAVDDSSPARFSLHNLQLRDAELRFDDQPAGRVHQLQGVSFAVPFLSNLPSDVTTRVEPRLAFTLNGSHFDSGAQGTPFAQTRAGVLELKVPALDVAPYLGYLPEGLPVKLLRAQLSADLRASFSLAPDAAPRVVVTGSLGARDVALQDAHGAPLATWSQLTLGLRDVQPLARQLSFGRLALDGLVLQVSRDAQGHINLLDLAEPTAPVASASPSASSPASSPTQVAAPATPPWAVQLDAVELSSARVDWRDAAPKVALTIDGIALKAGAVQWPMKGSLPLSLAATLRHPDGEGSADTASKTARNTAASQAGTESTLAWQGDVGLAPLQAKGTLRITRLPAHLFDPYLASQTAFNLRRAELGYEGSLALQLVDAGTSVQAGGELRVANLRVQTRPRAGEAKGEPLLSWQMLALDGLQANVVPNAKPQVSMRRATVSDLYASLLVTEAGRFNLQEVAAAAPPGAASAPATAANASAPVAAASASAPARSEPQDLPVDLSVGEIRLVKGRVDFSDHFIRPNYSTQLSELNGRLGAFRSGSAEMAPLEIHGRAAGTAQLDIVGQLNPTANPPVMDLSAKATGLELAPFSAYSGKYAGYGIQRGQLSAELAYKVSPQGQLEAQNKLVINQLTFGDRVESPVATKLPVLLAVALLKDRHGVIDVNLPVRGSLQDPQFSVGKLILQVVINLLTKAITSPFSLLAGGGSEEAGQIAFVPGSARMTEASRATIDKLAQSLADRPSLTLTITGAVDPSAETEAFRALALDARLAGERSSSGDAAGTALSADERAQRVRELYRRAPLPDKPRNALGLARDIPVAEMEALLLPTMPAPPEALRELALQRAVAVREALLAKGLAGERLFLAAPRLHERRADEPAWVPHAELQLAVP